MMKKFFWTSLAGLTVLTACGGGENLDDESDSANGSDELVISTWGFAEDFFREEVFTPFEEEHGVTIVLDTGNNAERLSRVEQGSSKVDLIYLSDYYAQQGIEADLFETIDRENIPNLDDIYDVAKAPTGEEYGPAYTIAQFGIAYHPDRTDKDISSWADLWDAELERNITIPGITTTSGPMFLDAASRVAGNETFNEDEAFTQLANLNPNIVTEYEGTSEFVNMFVQGEVAAGPIMEMFFADVQESVPEAQFISPEEGGYAVINTVNIVKGSENKELAEAFIDWILSEEVQRAAALAKIDSPVHTSLNLTEEEAEGITYGDDVIESLIVLDMSFVNENNDHWIDRWNREFAQ
ncbi:ABC transporter substrate-binding protein [Salipaludibacillus agaradhaerens]|uniref:ABC transporter substrate-binding protein n=2 Tax=Salipaludibacillus agaradhaerens TaxID=76935 RepID=A0A9Q4B2Q9_SALAG|nr:ABC transporter substrate-binding protein [Salipaludibacillus agaradhaerens]MCR6097251.1 ABC transporter substrate-binding protein [Salipaludibacillus agaradhaerens]MCR6105927.1 ABC transporter substrate-binding protein [Salipaludibacillus agaradhaerens]MCR6113264.1 ABC transporter substrate-binding protein [Salipaludibacillus agaradhaerens]MCR6117960.1 ABC transporter substrate-binding protein [Salipaludibacillus agaradhaerens]